MDQFGSRADFGSAAYPSPRFGRASPIAAMLRLYATVYASIGSHYDAISPGPGQPV
ncbi:MAG: hypothetical protein WCE73_13515 [Candidatus Angelobacter sp.]